MMKLMRNKLQLFHWILFILFFLLISAGNNYSESNSTDDLFFSGTFDEAIAQAQTADKPVFIFAYTDWCGYCKKFKTHTLADSQVRVSLKENFISIQVNMESEDGIRIARKYLVNAYPTLLFVNPSSDEILRITGYQDIGPFLRSINLAQQQKVSCIQPAE